MLIAASQNLSAQDADRQAVIDIIDQLFEGMRTSDSTKAAAAFTPGALLQTIGVNEEGEAVVNQGNLADFLIAVGTPKEESWDEQVHSYDINIDGSLATAWTPYSFYRGEEFSHCGVNAFQLIQKKDGWKIFAIIDTRRTTNCQES